MKKLMMIIGLITLATSFTAQACPDLEGEYICRGAGQVQEVQIQQDKRNDIWSYYLDLGDDEITVLTDGKTHNLGTFQRIQNASYKANCQAKTLKVNATGDIIVVGRSFRAQSQMSFTPAKNGSITSTASLVVNGRTLQNVKLDCRPL
jgi:hypothetical protein